jgi:hypothetical protein
MAQRIKHIARPEHAFVGNDTYSIEWLTEDEWQDKHLGDKNGAETHASICAIFMRLRTGAPESRYQEVLLHELTHCAWDTTQLCHQDFGNIKTDDLEEFVIGIQTAALLFIMKHNPQVVAWLLSDGTDKR